MEKILILLLDLGIGIGAITIGLAIALTIQFIVYQITGFSIAKTLWRKLIIEEVEK